MHSRRKAVLSLIIGVGVSLGFLVTGVQAQSGSLEPPGSVVDGSGDPVATTQTQPSWDQTLPVAERFVLVMGGAAVLDKESGLAWEQSPLTTQHTWSDARFQCIRRETGDQMGWRLPSIHELTSLVDPSVAFPGPTLSPGHPFSNVQSSCYWVATTFVNSPSFVWNVTFRPGLLCTNFKPNTFFVWCVRGGGPLSEY